MSYIINQDIIDRVGNDAAVQLTTDSGSTVDQTVLDEVRLSSEGEANGYLNKRYAVPVNLIAHPELASTLKGFVLDIAVFRLHARRLPIPEGRRQVRDDAIAWLVLVSKGDIVLPAASTPESTGADGPVAEAGSSEPLLSQMRDAL